MKALVCITPHLLEYKEMEAPQLQPAHAIIRIKNISNCGTDLHAYEGTQPYFDYPRILGHELSGELVDFNDAQGFTKSEGSYVYSLFLLRQVHCLQDGQAELL